MLLMKEFSIKKRALKKYLKTVPHFYKSENYKFKEVKKSFLPS